MALAPAPTKSAAPRWAGLTETEAAARLARDGPNVLPQEAPRSPLRLILDVVREPMFLLLLGAASLYLAFGDLREALTLLGFVVVIITITVVQEGRTARALDALRDLSSPRALVLRDGVARTVAGRDLVVGDVIRVAEGDRVPADAVLREGTVLQLDESLLTGESAPVPKAPDPDAERVEAPGAEASASLYSGTLVVSGRGVAEILATGARSELGRIGASLAEVAEDRTPLQREVDVVVRRMAALGIGLSLLLVVLEGLLDGDWLAALLSGITLAMALLPEELPVVLTVFLALGAWRIAKSRVLTRRVTSVETLGAVHVLCTDKTGTLTQNRMMIARLVAPDLELDISPRAPAELPEPVHELVEVGILACPPDPFDPMEKAFLELGERTLEGTEHLHPRWEEVQEYPLTPELLAVTHVWRTDAGEALVVATKGAPEAILDLCHLDGEALARWRDRAEAMAREGLRVLGVARGRAAISPAHPHDVPFEMVGLVGLADPLREDAREAVTLARRAGIRVVMITGDHPDTARSIATAAGLDAAEVLTGPELEALDDASLAKRLGEVSVIARAVPAHKLRIVRTFEARGDLVGMTGDGVNDAPALKAAHIGIAMGARGTDVAREAAALVLVDDDFGSIVDAVRVGRRIFDNLKNAVSYIVAVHVPIAGVALLPVLFGWGPLVAPVHVVFLELIIDPACSIVLEMEPARPGVMSRPPRARTEHLFSWTRIGFAVAQGALVLAATLYLVWDARVSGAGAGTERALAFVALVVGNLAILLASRSATEPFWATLRRRNPAIPLMTIGAGALMAIAVLVPAARDLFAFDAVAASSLALAAALASVPVLALDALKVRRRGA
ncbi:MAG: cation-translocating P-type ATPase [Sandaracinaceae bacterium]|nr:cation-translocating P-type ATPase [Sandaracinaceae bacterium]